MTNLDTLVATDTRAATDTRVTTDTAVAAGAGSATEPIDGTDPAVGSDAEQDRRDATDFQRHVLRALQNDVARSWLGAVRSGLRQDSARLAEASHALQRAARLLEEPAIQFERT